MTFEQHSDPYHSRTTTSNHEHINTVDNLQYNVLDVLTEFLNVYSEKSISQASSDCVILREDRIQAVDCNGKRIVSCQNNGKYNTNPQHQ